MTTDYLKNYRNARFIVTFSNTNNSFLEITIYLSRMLRNDYPLKFIQLCKYPHPRLIPLSKVKMACLYKKCNLDFVITIPLKYREIPNNFTPYLLIELVLLCWLTYRMNPPILFN